MRASGHGRPHPRRARRRAARGGRGGARAGGRAGRRWAPARPAPSRTASRTLWQPTSTTRAARSRSPSRRGRPARCASGCASWASTGCRSARSMPRRCASSASSGRGSAAAQFPELLPSKARLVSEVAGRLQLRPNQAMVRDLTGDLEWAKVNFLSGPAIGTRAAAVSRTLAVDAAVLAQVQTAYEDAKATRGLLDFEDVLLVTAGALADRPDIADAVRAAYRWFTVDEFQDVNPLQHRLLGLWLGDRDDVCVVGDANQTIYTFTGASPTYLTSFRDAYPDATEVRLVRCYRCTPQIVSLANSVISRAATGSGDHAGPRVPARRRPRAQHRRVVRRRRGGTEGRGPGGPAHRRGRAGARHRRAVPHQRPVGRARDGLRQCRRAGRAARDRTVLRPPRGARGDHPAARGCARRAGIGVPRRRGARRAGGRGLDARVAPHRGGRA